MSETLYICAFNFLGQGRQVETTEGIAAFKDGFWLNEVLEYTRGSDCKYFIPPHQILHIIKYAPLMLSELEAEADSSVIPLLITEHGEPDEPVVEVVICDEISGGADFVNNMPRMLNLRRILADGTEYGATYIQGTYRASQPTNEEDSF